jgi:hypothetical protein
LVSLEIIIKIGGLAENQVAEAVKAVLSEPVLESKEVKQKIRLINSMLKSMISARVFCFATTCCFGFDLSSLQCKLVDRKSW